MNVPHIIAHRGASQAATENTIEAFRRAIDMGADMIEFDVRRTRDGHLIAFHDDTIDGRPVGSATRAELAGEAGPPALVAEILDLAEGAIGLDIELKEGGYVAEVLALLDGRTIAPLVVTSFIDEVITEVKKLRPDLRCGLLLGRGKPENLIRTRLSEVFPVARLRASGADFAAPNVGLLKLGFLRRASGLGMSSFVWTVNEPGALRTILLEPRVAGIITDVPDVAIALRDELRS